MKVKALCNVIYGEKVYGCGAVFEIKDEDAPGLTGAVIIMEEEPVGETEEPKTVTRRRTRKKT